MFRARTLLVRSLVYSLMTFGVVALAQTAAVQKSLEAKFARTKTTADRGDIVTAGDVIVLQKDGVLMCGTTASSPVENIYKNGKVSQGFMAAMKCRAGFSVTSPSGTSVPNRKFVSGEKFWITSVEARGDSVVFGLFSDPISDTRYYAALKIPVSSSATPDEVAALVDQVLKVEPADNAAAGSSAKPGAAPPAPAAPAAPAPIATSALAPPPPPSDAPPPAAPTLAIGMTKDQVIAMMGQPTLTAKSPTQKSPTREIATYPNIKIIFVHDRVAEIQ
jgi:hypothetical protein